MIPYHIFNRHTCFFENMKEQCATVYHINLFPPYSCKEILADDYLHEGNFVYFLHARILTVWLAVFSACMFWHGWFERHICPGFCNVDKLATFPGAWLLVHTHVYDWQKVEWTCWYNGMWSICMFKEMVFSCFSVYSAKLVFAFMITCMYDLRLFKTEYMKLCNSIATEYIY